MYNVEEWRVLQYLGEKLPERPLVRSKEIRINVFGNEVDPKKVGNLFRKPVKNGHMEKLATGLYRLTGAGAAFIQEMQAQGYTPKPVRVVARVASVNYREWSRKFPRPKPRQWASSKDVKLDF